MIQRRTCIPALLLAWSVGGMEAAPAAAASRSTARLHYSWQVDAPVLAGGLTGILLGASVAVDTRTVPAGGLDPAEIAWHVDRNALPNLSTVADDRSDTFRNVTVVLPLALGLVTAAPGNHWRAAGDRMALWAESAGVAQGITLLLKNSVSRPRPFNYSDEAVRPDGAHYDAQSDRAFQSMPSGHASSAWCGAALLWTDPWLQQPDATWKRRAGIACLGSALATVTAGLRVEAGQHFPTDVLAGAAIGAASGTLVPLLHGYTDNGRPVPRPSARHWLDRAAGVAAGIGVGLLLTEALDAQ